MLAEFVKSLADQVKKANGAEVVQIPGLPKKVLVRQGEKFELMDVPAPARAHALRGLDDIVELCRDAMIAPAPEVYHSEKEISVVLDRKDRREQVKMALDRSERFASLVGLRKGLSLTPKQAIQFLRVDLHGTGKGVSDVIAGLRRIDFKRQSGSQRTTEHGRETLGRQVEAAVQQADNIPEDFQVTVPVFTNPGLKGINATLRCAVTIDFEQEKIEIATLADEIQLALDGAQKDIHDRLVEALPDVPIFNGTA